MKKETEEDFVRMLWKKIQVGGQACSFRRFSNTFIVPLTPGSWITTVWTKTKEAKAALTLLAGIVYREGRENMLRRIKAETRIKEVEAESKEFDLFARKLDYVQKIAKKSPGLQAFLDTKIEDALIKLLDTQTSNVKVVEIKSELTGRLPLE